MSHIYYNAGFQNIEVILIDKDCTHSSRVLIPARSLYTLDYPGLDAYVPALLRKRNAVGEDISLQVVTARTSAKSAKKAVEPVVEPVVEPTPQAAATKRSKKAKA